MKTGVRSQLSGISKKQWSEVRTITISISKGDFDFATSYERTSRKSKFLLGAGKTYMKEGVILYGDSVFFGVGASRRAKGCGKILKKTFYLPVEIRSKPKVDSDYALCNLEKIVLSNPLKQIVILFGNNDALIKPDADAPTNTPEMFKKNLHNIIENISKSGCIPSLCNLQPIDNTKCMASYPHLFNFTHFAENAYSWHQIYSDITTDVATAKGILHIDIRSPLERAETSIFSEDGLHPNDLGHEIIATTILNAMSKTTRVGE